MDIVKEVTELIKTTIEDAGYILSEVVYEMEGRTNFLRVIIWKYFDNASTSYSAVVVVSSVMHLSENGKKLYEVLSLTEIMLLLSLKGMFAFKSSVIVW